MNSFKKMTTCLHHKFNLTLAYSVLLPCISKRLVNSSLNQHNKYRLRSLNTAVRQAFARSETFDSVRRLSVRLVKWILNVQLHNYFRSSHFELNNLHNFPEYKKNLEEIERINNPKKTLSICFLFVQLGGTRARFCRRFSFKSCFI